MYHTIIVFYITQQELDERKAALNISQEKLAQHMKELGMLGRMKSNSTHILASAIQGPSGSIIMHNIFHERVLLTPTVF